MPPRNSKVEAMRLQQAKLAIKKMKQKRKEGNRQPDHNVRPVKALAEVPTINVIPPEEHVTVRRSATSKVVKKPGLKVKVKSRKRQAMETVSDEGGPRPKALKVSKSSLSESVPEASHSCSVARKQRKMKKVAKFVTTLNDSSIPSKPPVTPLPAKIPDRIKPRVPSIFESPLHPDEMGSVPTPVSQTKDQTVNMVLESEDATPTIHLIKPKKVYGRGTDKADSFSENESKYNSTDDQLSVFSEDDDYNFGDYYSQIESSKAPKIEKTSESGRTHMSQRNGFQTNTVQKPSTSKIPWPGLLDHTDMSDESDSVDTLCDKVSSMNRTEPFQVSGFTVTSVSDSKLPQHKISDEEEVSSLDDVEETSSTVESVEEGAGQRGVVKRNYNDISMLQFHFIDGQVILHLKHPTSFVFCGQLQVEMLKGGVEVLGYQLSPSSGSHTIFSPRGSSLLILQTIMTDDTVCNTSSILDSSALTSILEGDETGVFMILRKAEDRLPLFLEQYTEMKLFPLPSDSQEASIFQKASRKLKCLCFPPSGCNVYQKGQSWDEISSSIIQKLGCTVLCGGKGVGKSTMLRFLLNRYLSSGMESVLLIDFDPGQAELTMPGCVSISLVKKPLLGPNFTHLQTPLKCLYVGDVNVANCVSRYMEACSTIIKYWQSEDQLKEIPCLVNTMGFSKGLGVTIMVQLLALLKPTSVIQICSKSMARNYPEDLSDEYIKRNSPNSPISLEQITPGQRLSLGNSLMYDLFTVDSSAESGSKQHNTWGLDARLSREIVILSYLSQIVTEPNFSLFETVPMCCPMDDLYLHVCHLSVMPSVTIPAFNASLVALCHANPEEDKVVQASGPGLPSIITGNFSADCLGFGIVRGIDAESKQLYILTPVIPSILIDVNCLVLGSICLPSSIYLNPPKEPGHVPYVISSGSYNIAKPSKRSFRFFKSSANH